MAIKKFWFLIGSFLLGAPLGANADPTKGVPPSKVNESTPDDDKAAVQEAASEADKWAASHKSVPAATATKPANPPTTASPEVPKSPSPASLPGVSAPEVAKPAPKLSVPRIANLNEMKGILQSVSSDPKTIRLIVDGSFNVEFTYDTKSSIINGGDPIKMEDLGYNDELIVRYAGKDLNAIQIERVSKASRPE